jgi:adenine-specific DNA-methyltransferase
MCGRGYFSLLMNAVAEAATRAPKLLPTREVFRPVQFLGSKLRSLPEILEVSRRVEPHGRVLDIFTGSSVVAQGFAREGYNVSASDALSHSVVLATALLGVGRTEEDRDAPTLLEIINRSLDDHAAWLTPWAPWIREEDEATAAGDAGRLLDSSTSVPQIWRRAGASVGQQRHFDQIEMARGHTAPGLITSHYAGTYFGIRQAVDLDILRIAVEHAVQTKQITRWEYAAVLTALLSAASDCAFSAGKHFAQPHNLHRDCHSGFLKGRIRSDRAKNIRELVAARLEATIDAARDGSNRNEVTCATLEQIVAEDEAVLAPSLIYADPPYTAQQYSRFYHVPEVLVRYRVPQLQRRGGNVTKGLYPEGRFFSRFCSKRDAAAAFRDLCSLARRFNASLVVSYATTRSGKTGNGRMIGFAELTELLSRELRGPIEVHELQHQYRQFNAAGSAVDGRADREVLLAYRRSC